MGFSENFNKIKQILEEKYHIDSISDSNYDGFIVKQMAKSNCINSDISSHQTHIAITGDQRELFPYIHSKEYIEKNNSLMKNFFVIKATVNIFNKNCVAIENNLAIASNVAINFGDKDILNEEMCIYPRSGGTQIQLSMIREDSSNFIKFRKLIKEGDYLVFFKKNNVIEYDVFIIEHSEDVNFLNTIKIECKKDHITFIKTKGIIHLDNNNIPFPQRIFFGAPGTGKSYELNKEAEQYFENNYERVTFYPNYMYGHFVGSFKPFPKVLKNAKGTIETDKNGNIEESITYKYVPGILIRQLVKALKNPNTNYLLIIEEINRANVAAVFGDIFQLLDRNENGESEYAIATSKELQEFLQQEFNNCELDEYVKDRLNVDFSRLYLPSNFYIWATMNSADQGVMPMDTAFKRRWEFRYLGIDDAANLNQKEFENYKFKINSTATVKWDDFRRELNNNLSSLNISEDKLIGPYFIPKSILENSDLDTLTEIIKNKVLMYLYEDAAKAFRSLLFAEGKYSTYSDVCRAFEDNALSLFKRQLDIKTEEISSCELGNNNEKLKMVAEKPNNYNA